MDKAGTLTIKEAKDASCGSVGCILPEQAPLNQQKYAFLFQHMLDGLAYCQVLLDSDGKPVDYVLSDVNDAFKKLTGLKDKPVVGKKLSEIFLGVKEKYFEKFKNASISVASKSFIFEHYFSAIDKWLSIHTYCPEIGYLAIVIQDISQRKKTEYALKQSEKQYKKLANSITDLFFAVDSSLRFTYWNNAFEKYTSIGAKDAVGRRVYQVFGRDKTTKRAVKVYLEVMRSRRAQTFTDRLPKGEGNDMFEMHVYPTGNGISVFARDVTERKKLQEALEQYTKHLEELVKIRTEKLKGVERLAAIGETAGMIGHDIRNPLQSIIGEVYLAKEELNAMLESSVKRSLTESVLCIEEQTSYINKIVTDLQDYAKPLAPVFQEVDLEETIQTVLSTLDIPREIKVSYSLEKPFPSLNTDSSFIKRILTNLTLNGIQAMQENGGELTINAFPRTKTAIIAVADTGVGIPEAIMDKIFKPLFTTKSKGQGFGLAVVKKLVEALNGSISLETKLEKGTTFILEIPLRRS
jgi:PAS domain S-box-containing protein